MTKRKTIIVQGKEITLFPKPSTEDYISLTDIANSLSDSVAIYSWLRNRNTVEFIGTWEELNNPNFKGNEFVTFTKQAGLNNFNLTPKKWIEATNAIGIISKAGRGGGTYAHPDIAINFCYWLSPVFQLYLIKEFQRLKTLEAEQREDQFRFDVRRELTKINWRRHQQAVKLLPPRKLDLMGERYIYANEADLLNLALFGLTAKKWQEQNPDKGTVKKQIPAFEIE